MVVMLFISVFFVRLLTASSEGVYHSYDSGNIALAVEDYNISEERPHLPGYFLYVQTIKIVNHFTGSTHYSIILLMSFFSSFGTALFYLLALKFFSKNLSLLLVLMLATNPLVWFYGAVTEVYSFDLFFSVLFVLAGLNKRYIWLLPVLLAIAAGFRTSSAIILFPLFIYFSYSYFVENGKIKVLFLSNVFGLLALISWFFPMINSVGGWSSFFELISSQNPVPDIGIIRNILQMLTMGLWVFIPICILCLLRFISKQTDTFKKTFINMIFLWVLPALFVFVFIHYTRGYWLIAIAGFYLVIGKLAIVRISKIFLIVFVVAQSLYFLFMPFRITTPEIFYLPNQRSIGNLDVLVGRFSSQNSLNLGHIKYLEEVKESIGKQIDGMTEKQYLLLDPTMMIYARALQPVFSNTNFAELNLVRPDGYFLYQDMKQKNLTGRRELLNNSLIAGIPSFVNRINKELIEIEQRDNNIIFYKVRPEGNEEIRRIFHKYFQKR